MNYRQRDDKIQRNNTRAEFSLVMLGKNVTEYSRQSDLSQTKFGSLIVGSNKIAMNHHNNVHSVPKLQFLPIKTCTLTFALGSANRAMERSRKKKNRWGVNCDGKSAKSKMEKKYYVKSVRPFTNCCTNESVISQSCNRKQMF